MSSFTHGERSSRASLVHDLETVPKYTSCDADGMKPEEITIELGAPSVEAVTIYKLSSGAIGRDLDDVRRQVAENIDAPRFGARGPKGARLLSRGEYLVLRVAGARDETPWA